MWQSASFTPALLLLLPSLATGTVLSQFERFKNSAKLCPAACSSETGPANWTHYHKAEQLAVCGEPILLDYHLYTSLNNTNFPATIRACTLGDSDTKVNYLVETGSVDSDALVEARYNSLERLSSRSQSCGSSSESSATAKFSWWDGATAVTDDKKADVLLAIEGLKNNLPQNGDCSQNIVFSYVRGTLVGLYSGSRLDGQKTSSSFLANFADQWNGDNGSSGRKSLEICNEDSTGGTIFGVVADISGDFSAVQTIMRAWNDGKCAPDVDSTKTSNIENATVWSLSPPSIIKHRALRYLNPRADCTTTKVVSGDTCSSLASSCGISLDTFLEYNSGGSSTFCNTLQVGQTVCCTAGDLPDTRPQPQPDGTCAVHTIQSGEWCALIASTYGLTTDDLYTFNKKTWGWNGCSSIQPGQTICVSEGDPPMPGQVEGAICGPTVPGTEKPTDGSDLADLNPCPLNACCNVWGYCGTTRDYCTISQTETGNPGTTNPGENSCISNCGTTLVNNDQAPAQYRKIGYFQGYNKDRPCATMDIGSVDSSYTHVHFGFGEISSDLSIIIPDNSASQFSAFRNSTIKAKKILAFGGYTFSNAPATSGIFRKAVSPANRDQFSTTIVQFLNDNNLDGLDFDWEYPGATDIEGSDPGEEEDGENYLEFIKLVRSKLSSGKSLSIAAPASFWYLKAFPISDLASYLDYIVYMAYDLHGQWDVGSDWAMEGCPAGNCLRSHVNSTETYNALVMVTKAGVKSHQLAVGVSSYGRSFKMSDSTCSGPQCTFLGARNQSPAKVGKCTNEGGILADYEIMQIINAGGAITSWYDAGTDSDYLVYESTEWVAYMGSDVKASRIAEYQGLNFGGTTDWALDLQYRPSNSTGTKRKRGD